MYMYIAFLKKSTEPLAYTCHYFSKTRGEHKPQCPMASDTTGAESV